MNIVIRCLSPKIQSRNNLMCSLQRLFEPKQCNFKNYSSTDASKGCISNVKELEIPMPYGKLAAKAWGSEKGKPVLAFHGWLDNCGTFDKLIPLLSDKLYIVAIDASGHGMSSHKPPGCLYTDLDVILDYKKVVDYLGWSKFSLMGHSHGGAMALLFTSIFHESVEKVVALDIAKPFSAPLVKFPEVIKKSAIEALKIESKLSKPPPVYTHEAAAVRLRKGMYDEITEEGAEILLKRGARLSECGKGLVFSRDLRCRYIEYISLKSHELIYQYMTRINCEVMLIMASNTHPSYQPETPETLEKAYEIYGSNAKKFVLEHVDGNHFVHLNNPERIAPLINTFLAD